MAKVFVDTSAHRPHRSGGIDYATRWYRACSAEPASPRQNLAIQNVVPLNPVCLDGLLDGILANCSAGDDIIVVGHGRENGLSMRLLPGSDTRAQSTAVSSLGMMSETVMDGFRVPAVPIDEAARTCQITPGEVTALRAKISRVRALRLGHVALRGCKIGAWPDVLQMYKPFFGCREVSAPTYRDTYGVINPTIESDLDGWSARWLRSHRNSHTHSYTAAGVVVATAGGVSDEHSFTVGLAASSSASLAAWESQYVGSRSTGEFSFHGQWLTLIVTGQARIIFTGDSNYVSQLAVV